MNKFAVFIDRDGTINEEVGYVDSPDRFRILPGVTDAIRKLNDNDIPVIVITNQSGIARGYFSRDFVDSLHDRMREELGKHHCRIKAVYLCPHHPDNGCACRKPKPGMLLRAAEEHKISLRKSFFIGDRLLDVKSAHSVGAKGVLVLTGYGAEELISVQHKTKTAPAGETPQKPSPIDEGFDSSTSLAGRHIDISVQEAENSPDHVAANLRDAVNWIIMQSPPADGKRILIVKPSSLGDIIHSLPVLWALRKAEPNAYIAWVVKDVWQDILAGNPLIDHLIVLRKGPGGIVKAVREARSMEFDTVIDLQGLFRSGIITLLSGAGDRIGFSKAREFAHVFYNNNVQVPSAPMHAVDRYLTAVKTIRNPQIPLNPPFSKGDVRFRFPLYINMEDSEWVKQFLLENNLSGRQPLIAVNPSARWVKKRWPASSYSALINQLIKELKAGIIIIGSRDDIPLAEEINSAVHERIAVAAGKTSLKRLTALLEKVTLLITNDSGPMHIAAALGTPVVALFGPTDPMLTGPYGNNHRIIKKEMDCSPCFRSRCTHGRPVCMESISVEDVVNAVLSLLKSEGGTDGNK